MQKQQFSRGVEEIGSPCGSSAFNEHWKRKINLSEFPSIYTESQSEFKDRSQVFPWLIKRFDFTVFRKFS